MPKQELPVDLGYVVPFESENLDFEDSFVLGEPIYLDKSFPNEKLDCKSCTKKLKLLLQLFCPSTFEQTYNRIVHVFYCENPKCYPQGDYWSKQIRVFRSQKTKELSLPVVSRKVNVEKALICENEPKENVSSKNYKIDSKSINSDKDEKYERIGDSAFIKFQKRLERAPDQVLRYLKTKEAIEKLPEYNTQWFKDPALWINEYSLQDSQIPNCSCDSKRSLEFQILSTILPLVDPIPSKESIDWGVINVYTCAAFCARANHDFVEEIAWIQNVTP